MSGGGRDHRRGASRGTGRRCCFGGYAAAARTERCLSGRRSGESQAVRRGAVERGVTPAGSAFVRVRWEGEAQSEPPLVLQRNETIPLGGEAVCSGGGITDGELLAEPVDVVISVGPQRRLGRSLALPDGCDVGVQDGEDRIERCSGSPPCSRPSPSTPCVVRADLTRYPGPPSSPRRRGFYQAAGAGVVGLWVGSGASTGIVALTSRPVMPERVATAARIKKRRSHWATVGCSPSRRS